MKKIGRYWLGTDEEKFNLLLDEETNAIYEENTLSKKTQEADITYIARLLTNPFDKVWYYYDEEKNKHTYHSVVYDFIEIIIEDNSIEDLFNLLSLILSKALNTEAAKEKSKEKETNCKPACFELGKAGGGKSFHIDDFNSFEEFADYENQLK